MLWYDMVCKVLYRYHLVLNSFVMLLWYVMVLCLIHGMVYVVLYVVV